MSWVKPLIILILIGCVTGQADIISSNEEYTYSLSPYDFLGYCDGEQINRGNITSLLVCISNFLNPTIPYPQGILDRLSDVSSNIGSFNSLSEIANSLANILLLPVRIINNLLPLIFELGKYTLILAFKFLFVYLFYVSLGFQAVLLYMDKTHGGLNDENKIHGTIGLMLFATIFTLVWGVNV